MPIRTITSSFVTLCLVSVLCATLLTGCQKPPLTAEEKANYIKKVAADLPLHPNLEIKQSEKVHHVTEKFQITKYNAYGKKVSLNELISYYSEELEDRSWEIMYSKPGARAGARTLTFKRGDRQLNIDIKRFDAETAMVHFSLKEFF